LPERASVRTEPGLQADSIFYALSRGKPSDVCFPLVRLICDFIDKKTILIVTKDRSARHAGFVFRAEEGLNEKPCYKATWRRISHEVPALN
jgi:hypothetical protein